MDRNSDGVVSGSADYVVALRKESVDRNLAEYTHEYIRLMSLSARRAWIEILMICQMMSITACRSPQGERG